MLTLYKNEWLKMRHQHLWIIVLFVPLLGASLGGFNFISSYDQLVQGEDEWIELWSQTSFFYAIFLYPILSGIFAAFICRSDHLHGGFKMTLSLPVSRKKLYMSKFLMLITILLLTQIILLIMCVLLGLLFNINNQIPWSFFLRATIFGWLATFPLASIQLWLSISTKSFGIPVGINLFLTLGSLAAIVLNVNMIYPWSQPQQAMLSPDEGGIGSYPLFFSLIFVMFIVTFLLGMWRFSRKDID